MGNPISPPSQEDRRVHLQNVARRQMMIFLQLARYNNDSESGESDVPDDELNANLNQNEDNDDNDRSAEPEEARESNDD